MNRLIDTDQWVSAFYTDEPDAEFGDIVRRMGNVEPDELADVIEADGLLRLKSGRSVQLSRYLDSISGLERPEVAMDAAIEVCCRAASMRGERIPRPD